MAEFVGQDVPASCDRKALSNVNRFGVVIPNTVGVGIPAVHIRIRDLPNSNVVSEGKNNSMGNPQHTRHLLNERMMKMKQLLA